MEKSTKELRIRILPILLFCQANKGDLSNYKIWSEQEDASKKLFYAYYSGLFCRILFMLDTTSIPERIIEECNALLEKYNWYDLQKEDIEQFVSAGAYGCEIPEAFEFIDGIDNVAWKNSGFKNGRDAVCLKEENSSWTFADVRGSTKCI